MPNSVVPASRTQGHPHRVLLLGCSKAKSAHAGLLPALQRYDGPAFRVLRRYLRLRHDDALRIFILSAEFGLISADHPIPDYDRLMTPARAAELRMEVEYASRQVLEQSPSVVADENRLLVLLGKNYLPALAECTGRAAELFIRRRVSASQGKRLTLLRDWLYGLLPEVLPGTSKTGQPLRFRGIQYNLNSDAALEVAKRGSQDPYSDAVRVSVWSVEVDGQRVSPKWLVSQLTGLPASTFTTNEARSFLLRIGIETRRA